MYESQGSPDLLSEFDQVVARLAISRSQGVFRYRERFDSAALLWSSDLSMLASAFSARGGVDRVQAERGMPEIVSKFVRLSGHRPPLHALQVHMRGMRLFVEGGSYLTLAADVLEPLENPPQRRVHGIDMLINRNIYKCIFEPSKSFPSTFNGTLNREFSERFQAEFEVSVDFAPALRIMLEELEQKVSRPKDGTNQKPAGSPEIQRVLESVIVR